MSDTRLVTRHALAQVGCRLADSVARRLLAPPTAAPNDPDNALRDAVAFAREQVPALPPLAAAVSPDHPLQRLRALPVVDVASGIDREAEAELLHDLALLSALGEAHEGYAALLRQVHPQGQPWPTVALALHWLEDEIGQADPQAPAELQRRRVLALRDAIERLLRHGPVARLGLWHTEGDGPWHSRTLRVSDALWATLMDHHPAGADSRVVTGYADVPGLQAWLQQPEVRQAVLALQRGLPCHLLLVGGDAAMRHTRVRALLGAARTVSVRHEASDEPDGAAAERLGPALGLAWLRGASLWLEDRDDDSGAPASTRVPPLTTGPLVGAVPVISSALHERRCMALDLPQIRLVVQGLSPVARRSLWQSLLPQLGDQVPMLAARYPIEPDDAREVVRDLALRQHLHGHALNVDDVGACVRARTAWHVRPGIHRVQPQSDWGDLLLPATAVEPLQSAVRRVLQQITVLDDWGFAQGRSGRRGVRMLFYGPPGTGKTLAAEVMARALGVDLLVVDLSALVSKYIGETEKNLAAVFDVAERSRALLLFDEADALFAKRTDTQDAHDRYANLETAYLLQRLERYEGVAVLTTNLRGQLDKAFTRRFEAIVEFPEPDVAARQALWRLHLPAAAPLSSDVDLAELAQWYAISGAQIKNAALAAAFLAAAEGGTMAQRHFLWAIEREYDKAGRAHPGFPPHHAPCLEDPS